MTAREKAAHEQGLVSVLRQLHDDLAAIGQAREVAPGSFVA